MIREEKGRFPAFGALCVGVALGALALQWQWGLRGAVNDYSKFNPAEFVTEAWAGEENKSVVGGARASVGDDVFEFGRHYQVNFRSDEQGVAKLPLKLEVGKKEEGMEVRLLHAMGRSASYDGSTLVIKGLRPDADYGMNTAMVVYEYSVDDGLRDPEHQRTDKTVFWSPVARRGNCAPACALFMEKPRLTATGPRGSMESAVSKRVGQLGSWEALGYALAGVAGGLAFGLGKRKLSQTVSPGTGPLRVRG